MKVRPIVNESTLECPICGAFSGNAHRDRDCFDVIQWVAAIPEPQPYSSSLPPSWEEREAEIDLATREILRDLRGRKGFRQILDDVDDDVIDGEILREWRNIVRAAITGGR